MARVLLLLRQKRVAWALAPVGQLLLVANKVVPRDLRITHHDFHHTHGAVHLAIDELQ
jgi:hypothetical protein